MSAASWNLCRRDEEAKKAGFPDVCWWEEDRKFTKIKENHLETVSVPPDTLWFVAIKGDYMGRVVGNIFLTEGDDLPWIGDHTRVAGVQAQRHWLAPQHCEQTQTSGRRWHRKWKHSALTKHV